MLFTDNYLKLQNESDATTLCEKFKRTTLIQKASNPSIHFEDPKSAWLQSTNFIYKF